MSLGSELGVLGEHGEHVGEASATDRLAIIVFLARKSTGFSDPAEPWQVTSSLNE